MPTTTVAMTGDPNIDGLLSGVRWDNSGRITFSFPDQAADYGNAYARNVDHDANPNTPAVSVNETTGFSMLTAAQQEAARDAFHAFSLLTHYSAREWTPDGEADIRMAMSTSRTPGNTTAYQAYPGNDARGGDGWFNTTAYNTPNVGTYAYQTFFHEIGHGLGLKHGHEADNGNNAVLNADRNSLEFSTMTYSAFVGHGGTGGYGVTDGHYPQSFMMLDIAALQHMYGASYRTYAGDNTYRFDPNTGEMATDVEGNQGVPQDSAGNNVNVLFRTVWDGGGRDTYDFSAYTAAHQMRIDLAPGAWTDVDADSNAQAADLRANAAGTQMARGQVFNALLSNNDPRSLIENAIGGAGDDSIRGNQANNRLEGRAGNDVLEGFDGQDTLIQGAGGGGMYGGNGGDTLIPGRGAEIIDGGNGYDVADYSASPGPLYLINGEGKIVGGDADDDTLIDVEMIIAGAYDDYIATGDGNQALYGNDGNDTFVGGPGADWLDGGTGLDTASFGSAVAINLATGQHTGEAQGDTFVGIERFLGSAQGDTMVAHPNRRAEFAGGDGVDALYGGNGNDWLQGGKGADTLAGGNGFDIVSYADMPHSITAELYLKDEGRDGKITAGDYGYDTLIDIEGVEATNHADRLYGDDDGNRFIGLAGDDVMEGRAGFDDLDGGAGNDWLYGEIGSDVLHGGADNDSLDGGEGNDSHYGGVGDDVLWIGPGSDVMDGGEGRDTMAFARPMVADWQAGVLDADIALDAWYSWEAIQGSGGADRIRTNSWGYDIDLRGGGGDDVLACGNGADTLAGEAGADTLSGGLGADMLSGGTGGDRFRDSAAGLDLDTITDFAVGDRIEVSGTQFSALRYTAASGLLELDTGADSGFATRLTLAAEPVGEFVSALRSDAALGEWTEVRLMQDTDGDGVGDFRDNAIDVANADQRDTDGDGYGNVVDPDLNQDLIVDLLDLSLLESVYGRNDPHADFNADGIVDLFDLATLDAFFGGPPGRSHIDDEPAMGAEALALATSLTPVPGGFVMTWATDLPLS